MKNNLVTTALAGAAVVLAVLCAVCLLFFNLGSRQYQLSQAKMLDLQQKGLVLQALAADLTEYSRQHPDIDPLLQRYGMKQTNLPAASAPKTPAR